MGDGTSWRPLPAPVEVAGDHCSGSPGGRGPRRPPEEASSPGCGRCPAPGADGSFLALLLSSLALGSARRSDGHVRVPHLAGLRAAPPVLYLMMAVTATRAFGIGRAVFRYAERLVSHDAVLRMLADTRVAVYRRLERLAPAGHAAAAETTCRPRSRRCRCPAGLLVAVVAARRVRQPPPRRVRSASRPGCCRRLASSRGRSAGGRSRGSARHRRGGTAGRAQARPRPRRARHQGDRSAHRYRRS
ncbi:hypothetical protein LV779_38060 [Streptomyces thinghirensis]|nr:hypothetical protein [Streptomyces thinghirensis]